MAFPPRLVILQFLKLVKTYTTVDTLPFMKDGLLS